MKSPALITLGDRDGARPEHWVLDRPPRTRPVSPSRSTESRRSPRKARNDTEGRHTSAGGSTAQRPASMTAPAPLVPEARAATSPRRQATLLPDRHSRPGGLERSKFQLGLAPQAPDARAPSHGGSGSLRSRPSRATQKCPSQRMGWERTPTMNRLT